MSNNTNFTYNLDEIYERLEAIEHDLFYIYDKKAIENIKQAQHYILLALEELKIIINENNS